MTVTGFTNLFEYWIDTLADILFREEFVYFTGLIFFAIISKIMIDTIKAFK